MSNNGTFKETAGFVADKTVEFAKVAAEKTVLLARMAKVQGAISMERDRLKKSRVELGKAYYKKFGKDPNDEMADVCADVENSLQCIAQRKKELEQLKKQLIEKPCPYDDDEF